MNSMRNIAYFEKLLEKKDNKLNALLLMNVHDWQLCRTCLAENEDDAVDINLALTLGVDKHLINIRDMLQYCFKMTLPNDQLPRKVCTSCLEKITEAYFFKYQMLAAETVIQRLAENMEESNDSQKYISEPGSPVDKRGGNDYEKVHGDASSDIEYCDLYDLEGSKDYVLEVDVETTNEQKELEIVQIDQLTENGEQVELVESIITENAEEFGKEEFLSCNYMLEENDVLNMEEKEVAKNYELLDPPQTSIVASDVPKTSSKQEKTLVCAICNQEFDKQIRLVEHARSEHPSLNAFKCSFCNNSFKSSRSWRKHRQFHLHPDSNKFDCSLCGKIFIQVWDLKRHFRTHTNERPYVCNTCGKAFKQTAELKDHQLVHNTAKRYECKICGQRMNSRNGFYNHNKVHKGVKNYVCAHCGKRFVSSSELKSHSRVHMKDQSAAIFSM